jgi:hypothetical protein
MGSSLGKDEVKEALNDVLKQGYTRVNACGHLTSDQCAQVGGSGGCERKGAIKVNETTCALSGQYTVFPNSEDQLLDTHTCDKLKGLYFGDEQSGGVCAVPKFS